MNISLSELMSMSNVNIIDIRTENEYNMGHLQNAKNINASELLMRPANYLDKNVTYYIYCQTGITSSRLCQILNKQGYNTVNILGGYQSKR